MTPPRKTCKHGHLREGSAALRGCMVLILTALSVRVQTQLVLEHIDSL